MGSNGMGVRTRSKGPLGSVLMVLGIALGSIVVWPGHASASSLTLTITEPPDGSGMHVTFTNTGTCGVGTCNLAAAGEVTPGEDVNFEVSNYASSTTQVSQQGIDIHDPYPSTTLSDYVKIAINDGNLHIFFVSEGSSIFTSEHITSSQIVYESATGFVDLTTAVHNLDSAYSDIMLFTVQSNEVAVPEPASLLLLGSGLAGLAMWRRRQVA